MKPLFAVLSIKTIYRTLIRIGYLDDSEKYVSFRQNSIFKAFFVECFESPQTMCENVCVQLCVCVCVCVFMFVCLYVCVCVCKHFKKFQETSYFSGMLSPSSE